MKMVWFKDYYSPFSECTSIRVCLAYIALMAARDGAGGGGGYFLIRGQWGCAAGWGRIFKSGVTIMGWHFQESY